MQRAAPALPADYMIPLDTNSVRGTCMAWIYGVQYLVSVAAWTMGQQVPYGSSFHQNPQFQPQDEESASLMLQYMIKNDCGQ